MDAEDRSQIQCNPIIIDGVLYGTSPKMKLFALDAATGGELWRFDPFDDDYRLWWLGVNRGVTHWEDRIVYGAGEKLYAVSKCHGMNREGDPLGVYPALHLEPEVTESLIAYLFDREDPFPNNAPQRPARVHEYRLSPLRRRQR